jgi:hypothetical protein
MLPEEHSLLHESSAECDVFWSRIGVRTVRKQSLATDDQEDAILFNILNYSSEAPAMLPAGFLVFASLSHWHLPQTRRFGAATGSVGQWSYGLAGKIHVRHQLLSMQGLRQVEIARLTIAPFWIHE